MPGRALAPVALALLAGLWVCYLTTGSAAEANVPQGFGDETVIDDVPAPTALAFTFDDHLLVASRGNCMCSIRAVRRFLHITGAAFIPDRLSWPGVSDDAYFFGDFVCGRIFELTPDGAGG